MYRGVSNSKIECYPKIFLGGPSAQAVVVILDGCLGGVKSRKGAGKEGLQVRAVQFSLLRMRCRRGSLTFMLCLGGVGAYSWCLCCCRGGGLKCGCFGVGGVGAYVWCLCCVVAAVR